MARFSTTHWSVILQAGRADPQRAQEAVEHVCERYWYPLYAHARRFGCDPEAAKDIVQSFFVHLIEEKVVAKANPADGRFRTFLLSSLENHLHSGRKREGAQKRGGRFTFLSLDEAAGEAHFVSEPHDNRSPDKLFERSWAVNLLEQALRLLEQEYQAPGSRALFRNLQPALIKDEAAPAYRQLAQTLSITEGAVKVAVHRMRHRYREILTGLVASTISDPAEVEEELRYLLRVFGRA